MGGIAVKVAGVMAHSEADPLTDQALAQGYRNNDQMQWCRNPECHRPWHGLPKPATGELMRNRHAACPGSHEFEEP